MPACGRAIVKTRIAGLIGRPTHFCPVPAGRVGGGDDGRMSVWPSGRFGYGEIHVRAVAESG